MHRPLTWLSTIVSLGVTADCSGEERTTRRVFAGGSLFVGLAAPLWGAIYIASGELGPGLIPTTYSVFTLASFVYLWRSGGWRWFRISQLVLIFVLPFALMVSLGGYVLGSAVMIWAMLAPLGALWGGRSTEAVFWSTAFLVGAVACGIADPHLRDSNELAEGLRSAFFVMNIAAVAAVVFLLLEFFVRQKDTTIAIMRRNRELESAYLAQELALRQSDKLATLGRLSAGLAHELNNPTAAAQQATRELGTLLLDPGLVERDVGALQLEPGAIEVVGAYADKLGRAAGSPDLLDPLERMDREEQLLDPLERAGVGEPHRVAPVLVSLGMTACDIAALAESTGDRLGRVIEALDVQRRRTSLVATLDDATGRIVELVAALKTYSHLDRAPRQLIDIHDGLDSTLVMLQNRLRSGVAVHRRYDRELPRIEAHAGELNQVWTNLLDNAIDAVDGSGTIEISSRRSGDHIVVEITDSGPGVPDEIAEQIFDPFVTTKAPGEGTGLGLNIAHTIVTEKHAGRIHLASAPGHTTFTVQLPLENAPQPQGRD